MNENDPMRGRGEALFECLGGHSKVYHHPPQNIKKAIVRAALDGQILFTQAEHLIKVLGLRAV